MDITMCKDNNCLLKDNCLRFKGEPNKYQQSYFLESPLKSDNTCEYFYEIKKNTPLTEKEEWDLFYKNMKILMGNE